MQDQRGHAAAGLAQPWRAASLHGQIVQFHPQHEQVVLPDHRLTGAARVEEILIGIGRDRKRDRDRNRPDYHGAIDTRFD
ncbi:hypothetical protein Cmtc_50200 [Cupriavidus sp. TKC]|nr:hypothetical protein Cmtc_50200 [Cupriavidus sp. TKC]